MRYRKLYACVLLLCSIILSGCQAGDDVPETAAPTLAGDQETQDQSTVAAAPTAEQDARWIVVEELQVDHRAAFAAFADAEFGVTGTASHVLPNLHVSSDGGRTWTRSESGEGAPIGLDIVDAQSIWQCGTFSHKTSKDGGQSWQPFARPFDYDCRIVSFVDDMTGAAAALDTLTVTHDGGASWDSIALPETIRNIAAVSVRTQEAGYVLDFDLTLYSTTDGGDWSATSLAPEDSDLALMDLTLASAAIRFLDNRHGIVILNLAGGGKSELRALHTSDGGQTWEHEILPVGLGTVFLSHDGRFLTVTDIGGTGAITVLENLSLAY